jgi:bile acid-coenzyme A ligase
MVDTGGISIAERVRNLANDHPEKPACVLVGRDGREDVLTWVALEDRSDAAAAAMNELAVGPGDVVAIHLSAGFRHLVSTVAAWKLGATVLPLDPNATERELDQLLAAARPGLVVTDQAGRVDGARTVLAEQLAERSRDADPVPIRGVPRSAHSTGGSTGRPRIILRRPDWMYPDGFPSAADRAIGLDVGQTQLAMVPLHHAGFTKLYHGLALDHTIVLMPTFRAEQVPGLIERHRVQYFVITPTMMRRVLAVPGLRQHDLTSVTTVHQSSAACPVDLQLAWFEVFAPETVYEGYSSQERIGAVWIRGDEWLAHQGSVGRPTGCVVRIYTAEGRIAAPGEVGEVFLKSPVTRQPTYLGGGPQLPERDGFLSLGDAGYLDTQGYLHIVGRVREMINVGGVKVYPTEVEGVLSGHSEVRDVAVVARAHDYLGQAVHAFVVPADLERPPSTVELTGYCLAGLSAAKVPLSYEFVPHLPRSDTGKLHRGKLPVG